MAGRRCQVCEHEQRETIDKLIAESALSVCGISRKYGLSADSLDRHKASHVTAKLARAAAKKVEKVEDKFLDHVEFLMDESRQHVVDAHHAVKVQLVGKNKYERFRDIGAMGPAINAAKGVGELYGQAIGRLGSGAVANHQPCVVILSPVAASQYHPPQVEDGNTIDLKAITE